MPGYAIRPMGDAEARAVARWRYEPPYDFYDVAADPEDLVELLDPEKRGSYHAAFLDGELVGFFCFGAEAWVPGGDYTDESMVDIGLGLRPDLTGRGLGLPFVLAGLEFARERFAPEGFRLTVAAFNERAILIYERAGFRGIETFTHRTNGGEHPFVLMVRESSGVTRLDRAVAADAGRAPRPERVDAQQPLPAGGEPGRSDRRPS